MVDITGTIRHQGGRERLQRSEGTGGHHGSQLRAELAKAGKKLPLLGDDDRTADRNYIRNLSWRTIASWARNMGSSMRKRSTTSVRSRRIWVDQTRWWMTM